MFATPENPEAYGIKLDAEDRLEAQEGDDTVSDVFNSPCKQREKKICVVCMDEERGCRLHPCMHAALCVECAGQLKVCALGIALEILVGEYFESGTYASAVLNGVLNCNVGKRIYVPNL